MILSQRSQRREINIPPPKTSKEWKVEGERLLGLMTMDKTGTEKVIKLCSEDSAALLTYLTSCHEIFNQTVDCDNESHSYEELFLNVALKSLEGALHSTSSSSCSLGSLFTGKVARRIVTDGLLPLSSSLPSTPAANSLIHSCLVKHIIPTVIIDTANNINLSPDSTLGIEILLPSFLTRMNALETRPFLPFHDDNEKENTRVENFKNLQTVDEILNTLLCCRKSDNDNCCLRPSGLAALLSALREFETILSNRLSIDIHQKPQNRINTFIHAVIRCLLSIVTTNSSKKTVDWDSIPPLIYQLCLFSSHIQGCTDYHRALCLTSIVQILDIINSVSSKDDVRSNGGEKEMQSTQKLDIYASRWTTSLSLSHLSAIFRNHFNLCKVLLKILKGDLPCPNIHALYNDCNNNNNKSFDVPFRYLKVTPFLLAISFTMASSVSRLRTKVLEAIQSLVLEEELIRLKRMSSTWFHDTISLLFADFHKKNFNDTKVVQDQKLAFLKKEINQYPRHDCNSCDDSLHTDLYRNHNPNQSVMITCLLQLIKLAHQKESKHSSSNSLTGGSMNAEYTYLLQSIVSLGFTLIDSVKKDKLISIGSDNGCEKSGAFTLPPITNTASIVTQNTVLSLMSRAKEAASQLGQSILCHLFVLAAGGIGDEGSVVIGAGGYYSTNAGSSASSPICRSILLTASEKFCGMAPNAFAYSSLLRRLVFYRLEEQSVNQNSDCTTKFTFNGADILAESNLPMIIDFLSHVPAGGMLPLVALTSVIPSLEKIMRWSQWKGRNNRQKQSELDEHLDHCFLLAKKALFCTDADRRQVAVSILIMLLGIAMNRSYYQTAQFYNKSSNVMMSPNINHDDSNNAPEDALVDEIIGYLRRCLTQHQAEVRLEVYSSLVKMLPPKDEASSSVPNSPVLNECDEMTQRIRMDNEPFVSSVVSKILLAQLQRYVSVQEDVTMMEARRQRAIQHGSQLSQPMDAGESLNTRTNMPLRLDLCISQRAITKTKRNLDVISEATLHILEPIVYLISSCFAIISNSNSSNALGATVELRSTLKTLLSKVAESEVEQYIQVYDTHDKSNKIEKEKCNKKLSVLLLLAAVAETMMGQHTIFVSEETSIDFTVVEQLFNLRKSAIAEASLLMRSIVSLGKRKNARGKAALKSKKNSESADEESNDDSDVDNLHLSSNELNQASLNKHRESLEKRLSVLCPSLPYSFLACCIRSCSNSTEGCGSIDPLYASQDGESCNVSALERLTKNIDFRCFLIRKCKDVLSGTALVVRAGCRSDAIAMLKMDEDLHQSMSNFYIAASLQLGPLLFTEFILHCRQQPKISLQNINDNSLSQMALESFVLCVRRMSSNVENHAISKIKRISTLLRFSYEKVREKFPDLRTRLNIFLNRENDPCSNCDFYPEEETILFNLLKPLIGAAIESKIDSKNKRRFHGGIMGELATYSLDNEVTLCCDLISAIATNFNSSLLREKIIINVLKSLDKHSNAIKDICLLQIDVGEEYSKQPNCPKGAARVIDAALLLDGLLDGSTPISIDASEDLKKQVHFHLRMPYSKIEDSTDKYSSIPMNEKFNEFRNDKTMGLSYRLSLAFLSEFGIGANFELCSNSHDVADIWNLPCLSFLSDCGSEGTNVVSKERSSAVTSITNGIESSMNDVEFTVLKIMPHVKAGHLYFLQKNVFHRMYAISKVFCTMAFSAEKNDDNGSVVSFLLKISKRFYGIHSRIMLNNISEPKNVTCFESRQLLHTMTTKMTPRIMALLLTMQEMLKIGNGKMLAESKIQTHGRIAADVVFEKEKNDNSLIKLSLKMKALGYDKEYKWLEKQVVSSCSRDFRIKKDALKALRSSNVNRLKTEKRNLPGSFSQHSRKSKRKKRIIVEDEGDDDSDPGSVNNSLTSLTSSRAELDKEENDVDSEDTLSDTSEED